MFGFGKKNTAPTEAEKPSGLLARLKQGLGRTRAGFTEGLARLLAGRKQIDAALLEELETLLIRADVGINVTQMLMRDLEKRISRQQVSDGEALFHALAENMEALLTPVAHPLQIPAERTDPFVILVVGINGAGKTTTIGKLSKHLQQQHYSVMLAAGDTFRAAAVEQLKSWGERNHIPVIAQHNKADAAAVIFDAMSAASARHIDVLIADTAGRLHTQDNLMAELQKVSRVMGKQNPSAPHETLLVLDAGIGQNALNQALEFHQAIHLTGLVITKLDGTAKGGIIFAIAQKLGLPIRFIGIGEGLDDLREFNAHDFVQALLSHNHSLETSA
jgi:fused signal recognition particle receptor